MIPNHLVNQWITKAFQSYLEDKERQIYLTRILSVLTQSDQLWSDDSPLYDQALQQTLSQFCQDFNTSSLDVQAYGEWSQLIQSFNRDLQQQLRRLQAAQDLNRLDREDFSSGKDSMKVVSSLTMQIYEWVKSDIKGELRATHLANYPAANCQTLIERRLPPEQSWEEIAADLGLSVPVISGFYQQECLPRLRRCSMSQNALARPKAC
ncbi:hypothetical protein [Acaryochloris marina]|uniref:hypothetical protein n=1 Tax=Acaryochloris marina TaxID=155978 RepID=UPI0021C42098|nr:hypothetical protein [Acaryochloris marina]BDM82602.1 hypothetical protein AM10699_54630 [Acaryochloris marina MBIC10699]